MSNLRAAKVTIDLGALTHNFQQVKKYVADCKIMPVIKANAYGHGLLKVAQCLSDADGFAVAQLSEALFLREHKIDKPICIFQGFSNQQQLQSVIQYGFTPAISQFEQIDLLDAHEGDALIDVWLKINTGMGRLGFQLEDVQKAYQRLEKNKLIKSVGLMMHFANADEPAHLSNKNQIENFIAQVEKYKACTSASNSAAIISRLYPQALSRRNLSLKEDWVRPGIMLYGASPLLNKTASELQLQPVMSVQAELIAINRLKKGQSVGYGDTWLCPEDMPVGIVNIGYGDGYPRHAEAAPLMLNGMRTKLIGRVSMDSIAIDLRDINAKIGDQVECWGKSISVDEVAGCAETIAYELLCHVGKRDN